MIKKIIKRFLFKFLQKNYLVKILTGISQIHIQNNKKQMAIYSFDTIGHCINTWGYYEWQVLDIFDLWIKQEFPEKKKLSVLDIGANIGNHTVFFAERFLKIFAYEPVLRNFKLLKLNTEDLENVEIFNYGISDVSEEKNITINKDNMGGSNVVNNSKNLESFEKIKLKNLNVENILSEKIGIVKIDVEGMEHQALLGISNIIKRDSPIILFENEDYKSIVSGNSKSLNFLKSLGYSNFYTFKMIKKNRLINLFFEAFMDEKFEVVKLSEIKKIKDYSMMIIAHI